MQCGEMRDTINIYKKATSTGPFGGGEVLYKENVNAKQEQLVGTQMYQSLGESDKIPCNFIIRRDDTVTNDMFITCKGKKYDILSAIQLKDNRMYTILSTLEVTP